MQATAPTHARVRSLETETRPRFTSPAAIVFALVALAAVAFLAGARWQISRERYAIAATPVGIAKMDTHTGEVVFVAPNGQEQGRHTAANFDPFASGQAERKP